MLAKEMLKSRMITTPNPSSKPLEMVKSCFYVQVDASFCQCSLSVGYAAICRLQNHQWVAGMASHTTATDSLTTETLAIFHCIKLCLENSWKDVTILSDCQMAVLSINDGNSPKDKLANVYSLCRESLQRIDQGILWSVPREKVKDAYYVARNARNLNSMYIGPVPLNPSKDLFEHVYDKNNVDFRLPMSIAEHGNADSDVTNNGNFLI